MCPLHDETGRRRLPHLPPLEIANQSVLQFVTVCVGKRRPILANPSAVAVILSAWQQADHWLVGRYVIMPNHLHLVCAPVCRETPLRRWVQFWRAETTRRWPKAEEKPVWQKDFFDRQLRHGDSYSEKWSYVWHNPVRAGLVSRPEEWPWQGELNPLPWHDA